MQISLEEFASFVTDEAKACYIETVDLILRLCINT